MLATKGIAILGFLPCASDQAQRNKQKMAVGSDGGDQINPVSVFKP